MAPLPLETAVDEYFKNSSPTGTDDAWLHLPEVPDSAEITRPLVSSDPRVPNNIVDGNWPSKSDHLTAQYAFLREESTFALRRAIELVRGNTLSELQFRDISPGIGIYEKAFVTGIVLCNRGLGVRMCFSTFRTGVKIDWQTTKRLTAGSLIAISPANNMFRAPPVVAVVAARPMFLLTGGDVPRIDIFFPRPEETLFDPSEEYVIVEETSSFFEAQRHNMMALQRMTKEQTPLQDYIITPHQDRPAEPIDLIDLSNQVGYLSFSDDASVTHQVHVPEYVQKDPVMSVTINKQEETSIELNVLKSRLPPTSDFLDKSQSDALYQILAKELALIQGPPGTGKTHVSVEALRIMLNKMEEQRNKTSVDEVPPIIVTCQTNHALDQLLRHIATFEDSFVRLGGRSADTDVVRNHVLFNIMEERSQDLIAPLPLRTAQKNLRGLEQEFRNVLGQFDQSRDDAGPMDENMLKDHLTAKQIDSLQNSKWKTTSDSAVSDASAIVKWLGGGLSDSSARWPLNQEFGFDRFDQEEEVVDELTAEKTIQNDEIEKLRGTFIPLIDRNVLITAPKAFSALEAKKLLTKHPDLNKFPSVYRGRLYAYMVGAEKQKILRDARQLAIRWHQEVHRRRIGYDTKKLQILHEAKVIGCTSTGFAKYRPMIHALKPRVVLIEEAGECLEANTMPVLLPSLQHLILVGDHQQLRPRAQKATHNRQNYDISLFERLADNGVDYKMLTVQRRMPPEVRRLLWPIYGNKIQDHDCTLNRPPIPGLKPDIKTYFFHHENVEAQDRFRSTYNPREAVFVIDFVNGLCSKGVQPEKITILTFYNAQRRLLIRELRKVIGLADLRIKVVTVDSYQGEENDIIILSLVRNNFYNTVGFLNVANRVCVALSRARRGCFLFGNVILLENAGGPEWKEVIKILRGKGPTETRFVSESRVIDCE